MYVLLYRQYILLYINSNNILLLYAGGDVCSSCDELGRGLSWKESEDGLLAEGLPVRSLRRCVPSACSEKLAPFGPVYR